MNLQDLPLVANAALFAVSSVLVWVGGFKLSRYADAIARRTGLGHALVGLLLLGGITSLPEIAVAGTSSLGGNAPLAVNNLLGGYAFQITILALADMLIRKHALTATIADPVVLLQGTLGILILAFVAVAIARGDHAFVGAGIWSWSIFGLCIFAVTMVARSSRNPSWKVIGEPPADAVDVEEPEIHRSPKSLILGTAGWATVIFVAGYYLSRSGEAVAETTGLGSSFFGAVFIAISTSLPEISTVIGAISLGRPIMAMSDIFGTNLFDLAVIFLVDLLYSGGPVLSHVGEFSIIAALLGILLTAIYLVGLIERRDPAILGVGLDSIAVVTIYLGGIFVLYTMR